MSHAFIQPFDHPLLRKYGVHCEFLRLDRIDPLISGNKGFKLVQLLQRPDPKRPVLSFGGAYSNHLHALARFGYREGIQTFGVVRGQAQRTETLDDAERWGMRLHFVDRDSYRQLRKASADADAAAQVLTPLRQIFGNFDLLAEGGASLEAARSCSEIWSLIPPESHPDRILVSVGTGTTLAGLTLGAPAHTRLEGVAAIANPDYLVPDIDRLIVASPRQAGVEWSLEAGCSLAFAKLNGELAALWYRAAAQGLELDPVYTVRMLHYFLRRLMQGKYRSGERVLLVHTGGLQGVRGQRERLSRLASAHCGPIPL